MAEKKSGEVWTPLKIIQWAVPFLAQKGVESPRFDAECLVAAALGLDRLKVYLQFDRPLDPAELAVIRDYLSRRARREPVAYILGTREFYGKPFQVTPEVLIPRPETEHLVEGALSFLKEWAPEEPQALDLGVGSGCIAVSLALNSPARVIGVDLSEGALRVAEGNAQALGALVEWRHGSWFSALREGDPAQFHLIVSNPPYIAEPERGELAPDVLEYEPQTALFSGISGLEAYAAIEPGLWDRLLPGGRAYLELHGTRLEPIRAVFGGRPWETEVIPDLQGLPRVLVLKKSRNS
ncbi:MAG TPA: peptide chain release factor N(5)-glutamine methyltransferase [bacterium]|nr:peptide chain release factor N(5)-glutamine methyltransferase [bacterium]